MIQLVASMTTNPDETEAYETYLKGAMALIEHVGARITQRIELGAPIIGEVPAKILLLVEYPNHASVRRIFDSAAYKALIPFRDRAFLDYNICLVERNDFLEDLFKR